MLEIKIPSMRGSRPRLLGVLKVDTEDSRIISKVVIKLHFC